MAIDIAAFAGSASIGTTEYSLIGASGAISTDTTVGIYQGWIDLANLVAGDELLLQQYEKARAADTKRVYSQAWLFGPVVPGLLVLPSVVLGAGHDITLDMQTANARTISWSFRRVS